MSRSIRLLFAVACAAVLSAHAQLSKPIYAIYGVKNISRESSVTSVNVGVIPSGSMTECQRQIQVYETGARRRGLPSQLELIPSLCTTTLDPEFQVMVQGGRIDRAYVLITSNASWAPVFTAWYNLAPGDPNAICQKLIEGTRVTVSTAQADLTCLPPR
jgi:hypothetical protein